VRQAIEAAEITAVSQRDTQVADRPVVGIFEGTGIHRISCELDDTSF